MSTHRYWRIYITANNGNANWTALAEIEMRASIGGVDQCNNGTASASSAYNTYYAAANAFNNLSGTGNEWCSATGQSAPSWIAYDFGAATEVLEITINLGNAGDADVTTAPKNFNVQYSDDNINWTTKKEFSNETSWSLNQTRTYPLASFKITGTAKFSDDTIATKARAWRSDTGAFIADATPDPITGAFTINTTSSSVDCTIFKSGYRPLTHGPITPTMY